MALPLPSLLSLFHCHCCCHCCGCHVVVIVVILLCSWVLLHEKIKGLLLGGVVVIGKIVVVPNEGREEWHCLALLLPSLLSLFHCHCCCLCVVIVAAIVTAGVWGASLSSPHAHGCCCTRGVRSCALLPAGVIWMIGFFQAEEGGGGY